MGWHGICGGFPVPEELSLPAGTHCDPMAGATDEDPTCPHCGEPVGMRATYCMHCGRYFEETTDPDDPSPGDDYATGIDESTTGAGAAYNDGSAGGTGDSGGFDLSDLLPWSDPGEVRARAQSNATTGAGSAGSSVASRAGGGSSAAGRAGATGESEGLLDPEGLADNALTLVVAVLGGLLIGFVSVFAFLFSLGAFGLLLALVAWLGSTVYLASRHTVFGAVRYGAYALAGLVLLIPLGFAVAIDGGVLERLLLLVMFGIPFGIVAVVVGGIGYLVGLGAPDETDPGL